MIFDSVYDTYRGSSPTCGSSTATLNPRERIVMMSTKAHHELPEIGVIARTRTGQGLGVGRSATITGVKDVRQSRVGDTVTNPQAGHHRPGGYRDPKTDGLLGLYPIDGSDRTRPARRPRQAQLNDAALAYEPETSAALGFGFRCGFLGLLHLEIVRERLEREFNLDLISTQPNVVYG